MKTQMRFQKILFKVTLIISALAIVFALAFCTGAIAYIGHYENLGNSEIKSIYGSDTDGYYSLLGTYDAAQTYTGILLALGIVFIALVIVAYAFAGASRRNYYKSNYITIAILAVYAIVWAVLAIVFSLTIQVGVLTNEAWTVTIAELAETDPGYMYSGSTWIYVVGYILAVFSILDGVALIYNIIWKSKLMKGEKKLLEQGLVKEVA